MKGAITEVRSEPVRMTATIGKDGVITLAVGEQVAAKGKPFQGKITDLKVTVP